MNDLESLIRKTIEAEGPLSLASFMQLALQHPQYGYYVKGDPLGREGDFITAPEISQMFGEMIGLWCAEIWRLSGKPRFAFLELGPGRGTLMADALRATAKIPGFHEAMQLYLLESNETLRAMQSEKLAAYAPRFIAEPRLLPPLPLIALANEFFDALPIRQYMNTPQGWRERLVGIVQDRLAFVKGEENVPLPLPPHLPHFEVSPDAVVYAQEIAYAVAQRGGGALIVDYGYSEPAGLDTFQAVAKHEYADPLQDPGEADLTAHVDFAALRFAAEKQGAKASPVIGQGDFLRAMGIEIRAERLKMKAAPAQAEAIDSALQRLAGSDQMGTLFKVLAITRPTLSEVPGFP